MADSYSSYLAIRLPATGAYDNTWGATLNSDALNLLDTSIAGWALTNIGTATAVSLAPIVPGVQGLSRNLALVIVGTPAAEVTFTMPSIAGKLYIINNQCGQACEFTYGGIGETCTVEPGDVRLMYVDGTNCYPLIANASSTPALNGIPAANWVRQSRTAAEIASSTIISNAITVPTSYPFFNITFASSLTIDANNGKNQGVVLTGNVTINAPVNPADGIEIDFYVVQDATGGRTATWNAIFAFEGGIPPVLATAGSAGDWFKMTYSGHFTRWIVAHFANIS